VLSAGQSAKLEPFGAATGVAEQTSTAGEAAGLNLWMPFEEPIA